MDVYENCPIYESERYLLRLVRAEDAPDLWRVYGNKDNAPFFNSDNCTGDFYCEKLEYVEQMIRFWLMEYGQRGYVRWAIVDKTLNAAVGTVELFDRTAHDAFDQHIILRLDVGGENEREEPLAALLTLIHSFAFTAFSSSRMATKCPPYAEARRAALIKCGYTPSAEKVIGHDGSVYGDYWTIQKNACR